MGMGVISGPRIASAGRTKWYIIIPIVFVVLMALFFLVGFTADISNGLLLLVGVALFAGVFLPLGWKVRVIFPVIGICLIIVGLAM